MKILIVEDDLIGVDMYDLCVGLGHQAELASWLERAEELLAEDKFDMIFLDHNLPVKKGGAVKPTGYGLRVSVETVVVGTSSSSDNEVELAGCNPPAKKMKKENLWQDIPMILSQIDGS